MLIKTNGAIKSIMNKNVQTNKLNFRIIIDKIVNLIKENQSHESISLQGQDMGFHSFIALLNFQTF